MVDPIRKKIREYPQVNLIEDLDAFPVSRIDGFGTTTTYYITWADSSAQIMSELSATAVWQTGADSEFAAIATALSGKEPTIAAGTTGQYWRGDKSWQTLTIPAAAVAATATPIIDGTAAVGVSTKYAREDHIHPIPTSDNVQIGSTATIAETGLTLLAISVRRVSVAVTGVVAGKNYLAFPTAALPSGFGIVDAICTTNGTLIFGIVVPIITGAYSFSVRVIQVNI